VGFFNRVAWRPNVDREIDEELAFHLEMRTREYIERGMDPAAARREAEKRLGNVERTRAALARLGKERNRHMRRTQYLGELRQDIAFAWRQLLKSPGFAAVAVLTLALGMGGTTAIFSAVYAVVLQPLPLADPARLMVVAETYQAAPSDVSAGNYTDAAAGVTAFEGMSALRFSSFNLSEGTVPERVIGARTTANYFDVMGVAPMLGRTFTAEEDQPGSDRVVILSHRLWTRRFGANRSVVGTAIRMNGTSYTVVGVMPQSFDLTTDSEELWTPIAFTPAQKVLHDEHYLTVYGRLRPGATRAQADQQLEAVAVRLRREFPRDAGELKYTMTPFRDRFVADYDTRLFVLLAAVGVVLLIACGNVANLLLARGAARAREIAVRSALGAGQSRIVRQLLTESVVLALAAAGAGLLLARWFIVAVVAWSPQGVPRLEQARIDPLALGVAVALAFFSSVVCGLAPALRLARTDVHTGLRDGGRGATGGGFRDRLRASLIAGEVALSLLLLFGAGLLIRSALALQQVDPGFDPHGVISARVALPQAAYGDPARIVDTFERMAAETASMPGVSHAALTSFAAMGPGGNTNGLLPDDGRAFDLKNLIPSRLRMITPGFFQTMRIPIVKGRGFDATDRRSGQRAMIVSEALAARAFPGQDPIGKRIGCCEQTPDKQPVWKVVVGVAGDVRSYGPAIAPRPEFYLPLPQAPDDAWNWTQRVMYIVARTEGDPAALTSPLRAMLARIDPELPLYDVRPMDQRLAGTLETARFNTLLLSLLGGIGLLLAASGIYGVIAYFVSQRTQEIGVRIALGASTASVVRLILAQAMRPVAAGAALGVVAALTASRVIASQLFNVSRTDPLTIGAVVAALVAVALAASAVPARRAAAVDPTRALQSE
jgi:putative ABC transport system permease protein